MRSGELLKEYRLRTKKTQKEVAQALGTIQGNISKWESGQTTPSEEIVFKIIELTEYQRNQLKNPGYPEDDNPQDKQAANKPIKNSSTRG